MWDIMREFAFQEQTKIDSAIELTAKAAAIRSVSSSFRPNFRFNVSLMICFVVSLVCLFALEYYLVF